MKVKFDKSFSKSIDKLKNKQIKLRIKKFIISVEEANKITDISSVTKMRGYDTYYRSKIGSYRIGIEFKNDILIFIIAAHRKDIYKNFP